MGLVGAACRNAGCLGADPAQDSIARHWLDRVGWGRNCCGVPYPTSHGWRGLSAKGGAFAARASGRLGLNGGMWLNKVRLQSAASVGPPPNNGTKRTRRSRILCTRRTCSSARQCCLNPDSLLAPAPHPCGLTGSPGLTALPTVRLTPGRSVLSTRFPLVAREYAHHHR